MRFWFAGPRIGFFRPGVSFNVGGGQRRAPQAGPHGGDFVYVIKGEHGHVKIGVSTDPAERLRTLQTGCSFPLALSWFSPVAGDAYAVEQEAHAMLAAHRLSGEWFDIQPEGAIGAVYGAAYRLGVPLSNAPGDSSAWNKRLLRKAIAFIIWIAVMVHLDQNTKGLLYDPETSGTLTAAFYIGLLVVLFI